MAVMDKQLVFADAQAVTTTGQVSTNTYHTDPWAGSSATDGADMGTGAILQGEIIVTETVTSGTGGSTVQFQVRTHTDATLGAGALILWKSEDIVKTTLVAGYRIPFAIPANQDWKKWIGGWYTVSATLTAGKFSWQFCVAPASLPIVGAFPSGMNFA